MTTASPPPGGRVAAGDEPWRKAAEVALQRAPDPPQAAELLDRLLGALSPQQEAGLRDLDPEAVADVLHATCGVAPFLATRLVRQPEWLSALAREDYAAPARREIQAQRLDARLVSCGDADRAMYSKVLREFKYYELARITVRDCSERWLPLERSSETLAEVSQLADLLLDRSLRLASEWAAESLGPARWRASDPTGSDELVPLGFCVLGLGKLGSEELNYSSDVDLVYVFRAPPGPVVDSPEGGAQRSPAEYYTRVAQTFGTLVAESTAEGFLYRVDLDLRPEGAQGSLVISDAALASYYEIWADTWEKAAFMKARPVAGDLELGWQIIRAMNPMIYRSTMDFAAVASIKSLKSRIADAHGRGDAGFNVKIDSGGIRDIEFIAQAMQLLHGGRVAQVRARSTQDALERLAGVEILPAESVARLLESYRFLRRLENRIQMVAERQTHILPGDGGARAHIRRAMGYVDDGGDEVFEKELEMHRHRVLSFFDSFFVDEGVDRIEELFFRNVRSLGAMDSSRAMLQRISEHFARAIGASPNAELALNNLDRFIQSIGQRRFYYELLADRPELIERLSALFASSKFLSNVLASHPTLIEPVFEDPEVLIPTRDALREDLGLLVAESDSSGRDPDEGRLDSLRLFQARQVLNAGLLDIVGEVERPVAETALTQIAEVCLEGALEFSSEWLEARPRGVPEAARSGAFLVVGMGKLASRELSYGSDLDLIFLFDADDGQPSAVLEAQEHFVRLAQRIITTLQTSTAQGACYEIDARLRPSGNQGLLVTSLAAFRRYHEGSSEAWERQALLRARPVAGTASLGEAFEALRREILLRESPDGLAEEIHRIRLRMEDELAKETTRHRNFKTGRGGVLDVETAAQYLQLCHAREREALLDVERVEVTLSRLAESGWLAEGRHHVLAEGWDFLQRLGNRLRIVENRSISDLDEERGDLEGLALRLGYESSGREGGARRALLQDYARHTEAIRAAYLEILQVSDPVSGE